MKPQFKDSQDWEQADLLMQPALIRVIDNLRKALEDSPLTGTYQEVNEPYPGHQLQLSSPQHTMTINIWNLCFQVCFLDYPPSGLGKTVSIDTTLITPEGAVDWIALDQKVKYLVQNIFESLVEETPSP